MSGFFNIHTAIVAGILAFFAAGYFAQPTPPDLHSHLYAENSWRQGR